MAEIKITDEQKLLLKIIVADMMGISVLYKDTAYENFKSGSIPDAFLPYIKDEATRAYDLVRDKGLKSKGNRIAETYIKEQLETKQVFLEAKVALEIREGSGTEYNRQSFASFKP